MLSFLKTEHFTAKDGLTAEDAAKDFVLSHEFTEKDITICPSVIALFPGQQGVRIAVPTNGESPVQYMKSVCREMVWCGAVSMSTITESVQCVITGTGNSPAIRKIEDKVLDNEKLSEEEIKLIEEVSPALAFRSRNGTFIGAPGSEEAVVVSTDTYKSRSARLLMAILKRNKFGGGYLTPWDCVSEKGGKIGGKMANLFSVSRRDIVMKFKLTSSHDAMQALKNSMTRFGKEDGVIDPVLLIETVVDAIQSAIEGGNGRKENHKQALEYLTEMKPYIVPALKRLDQPRILFDSWIIRSEYMFNTLVPQLMKAADER